MDILALILAALGFGFGVFTFVRSFGLQRRMTAIEEARRAEEVEARQSADVTADMVGLTLVLLNRGPAIAERVTIEIPTPSVQMTPEAEALSLRLDAGQTYEMSAVASWDASAMELILRWMDGTGPRTKTLTLALP